MRTVCHWRIEEFSWIMSNCYKDLSELVCDKFWRIVESWQILTNFDEFWRILKFWRILTNWRTLTNSTNFDELWRTRQILTYPLVEGGQEFENPKFSFKQADMFSAWQMGRNDENSRSLTLFIICFIVVISIIIMLLLLLL